VKRFSRLKVAMRNFMAASITPLFGMAVGCGVA
jgi:hypothetical protein